MAKHQPLKPGEMKDWRALHRLTQVQAAAWFNVPIGTYRNWEQGRRTNTLGTIRLRMRQKSISKRKE